MRSLRKSLKLPAPALKHNEKLVGLWALRFNSLPDALNNCFVSLSLYHSVILGRTRRFLANTSVSIKQLSSRNRLPYTVLTPHTHTHTHDVPAHSLHALHSFSPLPRSS